MASLCYKREEKEGEGEDEEKGDEVKKVEGY